VSERTLFRASICTPVSVHCCVSRFSLKMRGPRSVPVSSTFMADHQVPSLNQSLLWGLEPVGDEADPA
jgi:hypothetical protein